MILLMLHKRTNSNSVSTGLLLLAPVFCSIYFFYSYFKSVKRFKNFLVKCHKLCYLCTKQDVVLYQRNSFPYLAISHS